jgi:hypothetical protein
MGRTLEKLGPALYSSECVEVESLLKNSLGARIGPSVGTEYADLGAFRSRFVVAISSMSTFSTGCRILRTSS